ncbi:MAG: uroporphyrinogen-III synthase, partial [Flavobacteriaceae bacterium]|nr:uroporphyrinogen-III synthase [Flavobacteriaceae bacterium]
MISLLSTKKLQSNQRNLVLNAGFSLVEYDAIKIENRSVEIPKFIENAIFTSQNGVRSVFNNISINQNSFKIKNSFCVGDKTEALLVEYGQNVIEKGKNASELADFIQKKHADRSFIHFCGSRRLDEISERLRSENIDLDEIETYETHVGERSFGQKWDGILFFSPSGVQSFQSMNDFDNATAFCIGMTTAFEAKKYTNNVEVANTTSVESVIAKAVM